MILKFVKSNFSNRSLNLPIIGKTKISEDNSFDAKDEYVEELIKALSGTPAEVESLEIEESEIDKINKMSKAELIEFVAQAGLELPDNLKKVADIRSHIVKLIS